MNKTFRFLSIKDPHFKFGFTEPSSRNMFFDSINNKLTYLKNYIKDNNISYLFFTGDVFDESIMSKWYFKYFLENKKVLEEIKESLNNIAPYSIMGNHDFINGNFEIDNTPFGEYTKINLLNYFGDNKIKSYEQQLSFELENNVKINFYGIDYKKDWQTLNEELSALDIELDDKDKNKNFNILFMHENVVQTKNGEMFECIDYKKLLEYKNIDMWVLGHYHKGYPYTIINNKYFVNTWNFTRLVRNEYSINESHTPEFADIKISFKENKFLVDVEVIQIPCIPYKEAFKEEIINLLKLINLDNNLTFQSVEEFANLKLETDDDFENIKNIFLNTKFKEEILNKAIEYLNKTK